MCFAKVLQRYYELAYLVVVTWCVVLFFSFLAILLYTLLLLPSLLLPPLVPSSSSFSLSPSIHLTVILHYFSLPLLSFLLTFFSTFPSSQTNIVPYTLNHPDIISHSYPFTHSPTHSLFLGTEYRRILQM